MSWDTAGAKKLPPKGYKTVSMQRKESVPESHKQWERHLKEIASLEAKCAELESKCSYQESLLASKNEVIRLDRQKMAWQAEMLERASIKIALSTRHYDDLDTDWSEAYEKGPTE